jgi:hypothetical protein
MRAVFQRRGGNDPELKSIINCSVKFYPELLLKRPKNENTINRS